VLAGIIYGRRLGRRTAAERAPGRRGLRAAGQLFWRTAPLCSHTHSSVTAAFSHGETTGYGIMQVPVPPSPFPQMAVKHRTVFIRFKIWETPLGLCLYFRHFRLRTSMTGDPRARFKTLRPKAKTPLGPRHYIAVQCDATCTCAVGLTGNSYQGRTGIIYYIGGGGI
jgi:hypothetical protein